MFRKFLNLKIKEKKVCVCFLKLWFYGTCRFQEFYEEGEREILQGEVSNLRNQVTIVSTVSWNRSLFICNAIT